RRRPVATGAVCRTNRGERGWLRRIAVASAVSPGQSPFDAPTSLGAETRLTGRSPAPISAESHLIGRFGPYNAVRALGSLSRSLPYSPHQPLVFGHRGATKNGRPWRTSTRQRVRLLTPSCFACSPTARPRCVIGRVWHVS